jgi:hypothetical protein
MSVHTSIFFYEMPFTNGCRLNISFNKKTSELGLTEVSPLPLFVAVNIHRDANPEKCVIVMIFE